MDIGRNAEKAERKFAEMARVRECQPDHEKELIAAQARVRELESMTETLRRERDQHAESIQRAIQSKVAFCEKSALEMERLRTVIAELLNKNAISDTQMKLIEQSAQMRLDNRQRTRVANRTQ